MSKLSWTLLLSGVALCAALGLSRSNADESKEKPNAKTLKTATGKELPTSTWISSYSIW